MPQRETVVLVHGLWMTGLEMRLLGRRLARRGFAVRFFRYPSWSGTLQGAADALRGFVENAGEGPVHLLGHSLGGVVISRMLEDAPPNVGAVALLGSPVRGSRLAARVGRCRPGKLLIGRVAREGIVEPERGWPRDLRTLVVAGTLPLGSGLLFRLERPHDGVIRVEETRVQGAESRSVRTSHMGLLLSRSVVDRIARFYRASRERD